MQPNFDESASCLQNPRSDARVRFTRLDAASIPPDFLQNAIEYARGAPVFVHRPLFRAYSGYQIDAQTSAQAGLRRKGEAGPYRLPNNDCILPFEFTNEKKGLSFFSFTRNGELETT